MSRNRVIVSAWVTVIASIVIGVVHHIGLSTLDLVPEGVNGWAACTAFAAPLAGAGLLALAGGLSRQPALWISAGVALAIGSFMSPLALPLIIPAVIMICTDSDSFAFSWPTLFSGVLAALFMFVVFSEGASPLIGGAVPTPLNVSLSLVVISLAAVMAIAGFAWGHSTGAEAEFGQDLRA